MNMLSKIVFNNSLLGNTQTITIESNENGEHFIGMSKDENGELVIFNLDTKTSADLIGYLSTVINRIENTKHQGSK